MRSRIQILPEDLINKIAAGEVIERPASVVKELIENSIDAKASKISVEIQNAGRKLIRVCDNGQGMSRDEAKLSLARHSTSKINRLDDLFNIQTLGFRGEALPSIASVSRFEVRSKVNGATNDLDAGTQLILEGGKTAEIKDIGCPAGTIIAVKDIFFNTPARKKFIKSNATETGHIGDIVSKYTLANPGISFELVSDGKLLLSSSGSGNLKDAVLAVYGADLIRELVENEFHFQQGKIYGLISRPTLSRIDKSYETFFVNKRYVRNFLLNRALEEGYRTLIPNNRYPIAILFIDIDPKQIDVNVHPSKREIKFVKTQEVMNAVTASVRQTFDNLKISISVGEFQNNRFPNERAENRDWKPQMAEVLFPSPERTLSAIEGIELQVSAIQPLIPIYQYKDTYIICTDGQDMIIMDQHAAHERILYDQLSRELAPSEVEGSRVRSRQPLLIPETIEINPKEIGVLEDNINYLKELGFELEEFGNSSYILRSVPSVAAKSSAKQLLLDLISELQTLGKSTQLEIKQENIRKLIACHGAIKAGDKLTQQEMNQLIRDLYRTENPLTCPHGRPTMVRLSEEELQKRFAR
jgi:DNA mismatch repair protein MutL